MELQNTLNIQIDLKKEQSWRHHTPCLQTILQKYSNQNSMVLAQRLKHRPMVQKTKPRKKTYAFVVNQSLQRRQEYTSGERQSFNKCCWEN